MSVHHGRRNAVITLALGPLVALTGCGSSTPSSSGSSGANNKAFTVGFVEITEAAPVVVQTANEFKRAAAVLGWTVKITNANGDPAQMAAGVSAMVNQNVDAVVTMAIPPEAAAQGLAAAKAKGIPTIELGAPNPDPNKLYGADYAPDDIKMATMVAQQMLKDLGGTGKLLELRASAQPAIALRHDALTQVLSGTNVTVAVTHETDLTNPVQDTQSAVANSIRAHPEITTVWGPQDFDFAPAVTTITGQNLGNIGVYSVYLDPADFPILRAHKVPMAIADSPLFDVSWYALDALVNKLALNKSNWVTDISVHPLPYALVTPANVPATDSYPYEDFAPFFTSRWKAAGLTTH